MMRTRMSSKGQVVVPKSIREAADWPAGAELSVELVGDVVTLRRTDAFASRSIDDVLGMFRSPRPISDSEITERLKGAVRARWRAPS